MSSKEEDALLEHEDTLLEQVKYIIKTQNELLEVYIKHATEVAGYKLEDLQLASDQSEPLDRKLRTLDGHILARVWVEIHDAKMTLHGDWLDDKQGPVSEAL